MSSFEHENPSLCAPCTPNEGLAKSELPPGQLAELVRSAGATALGESCDGVPFTNASVQATLGYALGHPSFDNPDVPGFRSVDLFGHMHALDAADPDARIMPQDRYFAGAFASMRNYLSAMLDAAGVTSEWQRTAIDGEPTYRLVVTELDPSLLAAMDEQSPAAIQPSQSLAAGETTHAANKVTQSPPEVVAPAPKQPEPSASVAQPPAETLPTLKYGLLRRVHASAYDVLAGMPDGRGMRPDALCRAVCKRLGHDNPSAEQIGALGPYVEALVDQGFLETAEWHGRSTLVLGSYSAKRLPRADNLHPRPENPSRPWRPNRLNLQDDPAFFEGEQMETAELLLTELAVWLGKGLYKSQQSRLTDELGFYDGRPLNLANVILSRLEKRGIVKLTAEGVDRGHAQTVKVATKAMRRALANNLSDVLAGLRQDFVAPATDANAASRRSPGD